MDAEVIFSLISLIALENLLGVDNLVLIDVVTARVPERRQKHFRLVAVITGAVFRLALLFLLNSLLSHDSALFAISGNELSLRDLLLVTGGAFLLYKSTREIYRRTEDINGQVDISSKHKQITKPLIHILLMNLVFSVDSILTAIGVAEEQWVMYFAIIIAAALMLISFRRVKSLLKSHPSFRVLALCFLLIIGFTLINDGLGIEMNKAFIYFSMLFVFVAGYTQVRLHKKRMELVKREKRV